MSCCAHDGGGAGVGVGRPESGRRAAAGGRKAGGTGEAVHLSRTLGSEPLEVLLPEVSSAVRAEVGRIVNVLRLLRADTSASASPRAAIPFDRARGELSRQDGEQQARALEDLLRHHLAAHFGSGSFAWLGEPLLGVQAAWRALAVPSAPDLLSPVSLPEPGERALSVARRLVGALERLGRRPGLSLWRARLEHAGAGPRAGAAAFQALLGEASEGEALAVPEGPAALAGACECLLDRGAVGEAFGLLSDHSEWFASDERLRWLWVWTLLARGEVSAAEDTSAGLEPWRGPLPAALIDLRSVFPEAAAALPGRGSLPSCAPPVPARAVRSRREFGAGVLALFRFEADGGARAVWLDAAPGLREDLEEWLADRFDAHQDAHQPEHALVIEAAVQVAHGARGRPPAGALGARALALALVPFLDGAGDVAGWLHVECEHHLLPSRERLERLAEAWRGELAMSASVSPNGVSPWAPILPQEPGGEGLESVPDPDRALLSGVFRRLVGAACFKTARRHWWGIDFGAGEPRAVCEGGDGLSALGRGAGCGRALERCRATGGVVRFDDADERLRLHSEAVSGVALPIGVRGEVHGVLVIESSRRRDFTDRDVERMAAIAADFGLALRAGQFRAWHLARFGVDLHFDASLCGLTRFLEHLIAAGRSREPVVLSGERGVGKLVLARWVHFERGGGAGALRGVSCRGPAAAELSLDSKSATGSCLLEGLDELPAAGQAQLAAHLAVRGDAGERGAPLIATSRRSLAAAANLGLLRVELADELARMEVLVPPLRLRREEIPGIVSFLSRRFAADEHASVAEFDESAMGLLWRQAWEGNLRELESLIFKLVLAADGEVVCARTVRATAARAGQTLQGKLPSRHPARADLVAALRSTLTGGGRTNKSRAAAYLGWDPDTLCARMAEAHLDEACLAAEPSPWDAPLG